MWCWVARISKMVPANLAPQQDGVVPASEPAHNLTNRRGHPSLHIDIQIHISPEASAEQIDQIFASMAKHLKEL